MSPSWAASRSRGPAGYDRPIASVYVDMVGVVLVDDIQVAYEQLDAAGVEFNREPHIIHSSDKYELWMAFFKDPDENQLAIMDERGELS